MSRFIKIKIKADYYIKFRIWKNKEGKYAKTLAKIQITAIFLKRDMRRNVSPKFIEIGMETPCWCPSTWAPTWRPKFNKTICYWVLLQKRKFISRGTQKTIKWYFFYTWTVLIAKFPKISHFLTNMTPLLIGIKGKQRHACKCRVMQKLRNSTRSITKPRTHSERKFVWILLFSCSYTSWK